MRENLMYTSTESHILILFNPIKSYWLISKIKVTIIVFQTLICGAIRKNVCTFIPYSLLIRSSSHEANAQNSRILEKKPNLYESIESYVIGSYDFK